MNVFTNTTFANKVKCRVPSMVTSISDMYKHHNDAALQHICLTSISRRERKI